MSEPDERGQTLPEGHTWQTTVEPRLPEPVDSRPRETQKRVFVELIGEGCNISEACAAVGINRSTVFRWRRDDAEFAAQVKQAFVVRVDTLVKEAERRAMRGSDKLLMFMLCNYAPDRFAMTQKIEHSGAIDTAAAILAARRRVGVGEPGEDLC